MPQPTSREIVDRLIRAIETADFDAIDELVADDVVEEYPQSGECMRGKSNRRAVYENYPGAGMPSQNAPVVNRVIGSEDRWVLTPSQTALRIIGTGDQYTITGLVRYPNGEVWHGIQIVELRGGKISRLTSYFAAPFEPAPWRARWVESITVATEPSHK